MRRIQKLGILLIGSVIGILILEEIQLGKGYIFLANQYENVILRKILVKRENPQNIGIAIVLKHKSVDTNYEQALATVKCYSSHFNYQLHLISINEESEENLRKCWQKDFMFRRHCILSQKMRNGEIKNDWILFLDADMAVINPNKILEDFIPENDETEIVFYERIMNHEIMAGSYLVKNGHFSRQFLQFWAEYEAKLPNSFHGSDNGAIHSVIVEKALESDLESQKKREHCETNYWKTSKNFADLSIYEVCIQTILKTKQIPKVKIIKKGRRSWARDGWLSGSTWSENDFILHGWQKKRMDKIGFAMWHSPILIEKSFNLSICSTEEAFLNWRYKDSFFVQENYVNRKIMKYIQQQNQEYLRISRHFLKI